ncbi:MAG: Dyp-type peroxidase, partial [Proteobacteria bacterium]|nr:Dyp-type peroxidase [Pseudomonadota bacterium]
MTEAIGGTAMAAVPGAGSPAQEATDIQINILRGLTSDRAAYYFLAITDAAAFRNALSGFAGDNEYLHNEAERPKLGTTDKSAINVAFTLEGLRLLDVDDNTLVSFPEPFRQGMAARASKLGDTGESAPENWDGRLGSRDIHVVVALNGHDAARFQDDCRKLEEDQNAKGYRVLHAESGGVLLAQDERGSQYRIEHFGFRDGVSQPYVYLGGQRPPPGGGKAQRDASWAPIAPGEVLLGHQDEDNAVQPAPANPSLRRNGTYMVFRKLRQDVAGFRNFLATQRPDLMQRDLLAAQMVGRWRNGTPLVRSPDGPVHTDRDAINDFRYEGEDSDGLRCPLGAHIRRLNPRDTAFRDDANRHRLIRRGIPYGTYLPEEAPDDGAERGLLFVAFNARIDLQFEFLQQQWVNRGEFVGQAGNRKDPIIGANAGTVHDQFIVPGSPAPVFNLPRFVSVRGGDYFYAPGIAALKELAREATSGGPSARFPSIPRQPNRGIAKSPTLFDMDRLREIGLGLLRQQCAPTIAIRQVPLIDSQGALPRAQSIAIVAKRRHVARVLSEDLVYQIAPYAQRIWKISGQRMMIGMASNDPERIKRLAILHAAVAKLGTQRVA